MSKFKSITVNTLEQHMATQPNKQFNKIKFPLKKMHISLTVFLGSL